MQQTSSERKRNGETVALTHGPEPKSPSSGASTVSGSEPPVDEPYRGFLTVMVTPKITFSLPRRRHWQTPVDISQDDLREAFLSRFPVRFDPSKLNFRCATPSLELEGTSDPRLVYRIGSEGSDEERVLLGILRELDKAYSARYEVMLEEARADLLSSSMSFQVVADEIRSGQQAAEKKWGGEVRQLKEQMSTNQKRLFLLEQEKEQLLKTASSAEFETTQLRRSVASLAGENTALKENQRRLEAQIEALRDVVAAHLGGSGAGNELNEDSGRDAVQMVSVPTQTDAGEADEAARAEVARWQVQLSRMSEWLRTGAQLLEGAPGTPGGPPLPERERLLDRMGDPAELTATPAAGRWSDA